MENMQTAVKARLEMLGYTAEDEDNIQIDYNINKAEAFLKNDLNQPIVPVELFYTWCDMVVGMFLSDKKQSGKLEGFNFDAAVKSVSEGDVSVQYEAGTSAEAQLDMLLRKLTSPDKNALARFRRLVW